jgi:hypothetical protein
MNHETMMFGELESRRFQVLMAVSVKMRAFWDISPYSLVGVVRSAGMRLHDAISQKAVIFLKIKKKHLT